MEDSEKVAAQKLNEKYDMQLTDKDIKELENAMKNDWIDILVGSLVGSVCVGFFGGLIHGVGKALSIIDKGDEE